jgi:hypothetical protein
MMMPKRLPIFLTLVALAVAVPLSAAISEAQRTAIDQATGAKGSYTPDEDVYRVTFPRLVGESSCVCGR